MSLSHTELAIPASTATVDVRAFDVVTDGHSPAAFFVDPVLPGHEDFQVPMYSFLIENRTQSKKVLFDLGQRKDFNTFAPAIAGLFTAGIFSVTVDHDVPDQLTAGGISLDNIDAVIWSHSHFDHIGDVSRFPSTTGLVIGPGTDRATYPTKPDATLTESDFAGRSVTELSLTDSHLTIGGFSAWDYFSDGSLYLLNVPGHHPGHIAALARVAEESFVLLGADTCHHAGQLRPNAHLHTTFPCPGELVAASATSISKEHFFTGEHTGAGLDTRQTPLLSIPVGQSAYSDRDEALRSIEKLGRLDASPDVLVVLAHDASIQQVIELFPTSLNEWKEKGWKERAVWAFAEQKNRAFRFAPKV